MSEKQLLYTPEKDRTKITRGMIVSMPESVYTPIVLMLEEINDTEFSGVGFSEDPESKPYIGPGTFHYEGVGQVLGVETEETTKGIEAQAGVYIERDIDPKLAHILLTKYFQNSRT